MSPDGRWVFISDDGLRCWLCRPGDPAVQPLRLKGSLFDAFEAKHWAFDSSSRRLVIKNGQLWAWDLEKPSEPGQDLSLPLTSGMAISPDGRRIFVASDDKGRRKVSVWNLEKAGKATVSHVALRGHDHDHEEGRSPYESIALSPNGRWLVSTGLDATARVWNLDAPEAEPRILAAQETFIRIVAFSPDSTRLVTAGDDGTAHLWRLDEADAAAVPLAGHGGRVTAVGFVPGGRRLITAGKDRVARAWDLTREAPTSVELRGHEKGEAIRTEEGISSLRVSADGRRLVTVGDDKSALVWNLDDLAAEPIVHGSRAEGPRCEINSAVFTPDNRWLIAGCDDGTIRSWSLDLDDLIELAGRTAGRNLTIEEWRQYFPGQDYRPVFPKLPTPVLPR